MRFFPITFNLNIDGTPLVALVRHHLEAFAMTLAELNTLATKTAADVQKLIDADKAKIADLQTRLDAALAVVPDQASIDAAGATLTALDSLVQPTP